MKNSGVRVALVVAAARNGVIGAKGGLPWRVADDLKFFRSVTIGKPIVMGRKTFDSIGGPLPGRPGVVVTRDPAFAREDVKRAGDVVEALRLAREAAEETGADEICVIGGGEVYRQAEPFADRIYLTEIDAAPEGDAFYHAPGTPLWSRLRLGGAPAGPRNQYACEFFRLDRIAEK